MRLLQQTLAQFFCLAVFPRKPETAKLPLPQLLLGLGGREQAQPQERGERLKGQTSARPESRTAFSASARSLGPVLAPQPPTGPQGPVLLGLSE